MAKEVKEAVLEEPVDAEGTEEELSPWYVFCSTGCGFCKRAEPVVEELNNEGYDILTLDVAEPDNAKLRDELFAEYKTNCGTPWFINADTGKGVCGFREKDVLKKWLAGEDIPAPPRPSGPSPKIPYYSSTNKENIAWKREYKTWLKDNGHMPKDWLDRQKSGNEIIDGPRVKSDAPRPPMGAALVQATDEVIDRWGVKLGKWQEENKHLPNLPSVEVSVNGTKSRRNQMQQQQGAPGVPAAPTVLPANNAQLNTLDAKVQVLEVKLDRIISHFGVK